MTTQTLRPAVFLDRDDTLTMSAQMTADTPHPGDLFEPARVRLHAGVGPAVAALAEAGWVLVLVTNQGCVARGECTLSDVAATNARVAELLVQEGGPKARLDGVFVCPYHPKGTVPPFNVEHPWRKPAPGMILAAAEGLALDLSRSWLVGDAARDIEAAVRAGIAPERTIRVNAGAESQEPGVAEAVARILRTRR